MANCRKCGKPLVIKDGKCVYCGESVQGSGSGEIKKGKTSWVKTVTKSLTSKEPTWTQLTLRKTIISIIVTMFLGVLILFIKAWPGCCISACMFTLSVILTIYSFLVINLDKKESDKEKKKQIQQNLTHGLNIILLWGSFFFVLGVIAMFISWWAVLIVEFIGIGGIVLVAGLISENELTFIKI